ncbi:hypothetical protein F0562_001062 [Nyssa sinensis]|uniref:Uncharacterized protein n=1 Tax=Nyssa sinensis TaxID=561372 RepID=A0A5J5C265_9ASTE|nr:hypothetical protein F0562_001062 [Nyssa sinensis]
MLLFHRETQDSIHLRLPSFRLNIPTKINKGTVEIVTPVELIKKGDKGSVFNPEVLNLTEEDLIEKFAAGDPRKFVVVVAPVAVADSGPAPASADKKKEEEEIEECDDDFTGGLFDLVIKSTAVYC